MRRRKGYNHVFMPSGDDMGVQRGKGSVVGGTHDQQLLLAQS